jgi:hypothetical protein
MKLRKLYDKPLRNGLYYGLAHLGCLSLLRFHDGQWYKQSGDGCEVLIQEVNHSRTSWLDEEENEGPLVDPMYDRL